MHNNTTQKMKHHFHPNRYFIKELNFIVTATFKYYVFLWFLLKIGPSVVDAINKFKIFKLYLRRVDNVLFALFLVSLVYRSFSVSLISNKLFLALLSSSSFDCISMILPAILTVFFKFSISSLISSEISSLASLDETEFSDDEFFARSALLDIIRPKTKY